MDELQDMDSLLNGCRNIVEQFRDAEAMHASGAISDEEFYERQGRKNASLRVIAAIEGGSAVTEEEFLQMVEDAIEEAAQPSEAELLRADVDYLLMIGGDQ